MQTVTTPWRKPAGSIPALLLGREPAETPGFGYLPTVERIVFTGYRSFAANVGGLLEVVTITHPSTGDCLDLWMNEEAKADADNAWLNYAAMAIIRAIEDATGSRVLLSGDYVAGPVLLLGGPDDDGNPTPISAEWIESLPSWFWQSAVERRLFFDASADAADAVYGEA